MTAVQPSDTVLPPLLALPLEIKLQIFSYLETDLQPSLMLLRRTHSTFRHMIPINDCISLDSQIKRRRMLVAELKYPFLFAQNHYPCYGPCLAVLEGSQFDNCPFHHQLQFTGLWLQLGAIARPLGASRAFERRCDDCWAQGPRSGDTSYCGKDNLDTVCNGSEESLQSSSKQPNSELESTRKGKFIVCVNRLLRKRVSTPDMSSGCQ